jgi:hypothetical protein
VRPRKNRGKALRLAYCNADGVRGRKLELEQFLSEHGVDICLLNETHLESGMALGFAKYVCTERTARPGWRGTTILGHGGIDSLCCASLGSAAPGGYWHTPSIGNQTSETRSGLPLAQTTLDRVGPIRVPKRRIPLLNGGWSQRETYGLEF